MVEENLSVSQKQYVGAMEACMRQGSWTSGLEVFRLLLEDLRPRGLSPKQSTWRSLARGLRSVGQADQALVVLRQALRAGVGGIDEQVCSILLDLCAVKGRMGLAEEIASLMETHRIPKGPVTYCVLLKGYGRQRRLGGVESTMREMKERGIVPDVVALNAAVDAFVRCAELSKARTVLRRMEESPGGSIAQTLSYNTLIKGLGRELLVDEAFGVARGMLDKGCLPDEVTTNSLVDICVRSGNLDRAYNLLKNPTLFPLPPPPQPGCDAGSAATAATAEAGADAGGGVEGTSPGGAGKETGLVRPSVEAFTSVLTGFAGVGDKDRALAVFQQMVTAGVEPNVVTYTGLISACVNAGDMDGARRLFSALEARGAETPAMQPSAFTYNTLIRGLCRMGNDAAAVRDTGAVGLEEEMDMDIGIFADEDLLPSPDGGSGGGEGRSAGMATRPGGYFYERGTSSPSSPPSKDPNSSMKDSTGKKADGSSKDPAAEDPTGEKIGGSFKDPSSSKDPAGKKTDVAPGPSARNDDETVASFSCRGGGGDGDEASPGVESPPEILPASYAGSGSSSSSSSSDSVNGGAIPEGIQEALRVLLSMRRRGVPADEVTMNSIIDGLVSCSPPRVREAETLLKLMTGWGLKPNQVSFTVMLKGYGRIGDLGAAELMFEVMAADRDQRPDVVALNSILDACVRNGDLRRAVEILEQASASALSRRPIFVRHQDWLSLSSTRRPWGGGAGDGAVAICAAAAPGSGIGVDMTEERERVQQGGSAGVTGPGRGRGRDEGVVVDVWPNQVSFATVVLGLSRRGDAPAGRKAIKLYESMRQDFKIVPDEGMVDNLIMACCNAQAGEMDGSDLALAQGQEALNDLRDLGWNEELIAFKEQMLMRVVPTLSEVWKGEDPKEQSEEARQAARLQQQQQQQQRTGGKAGASRKRKVSAEIFEKYGWNKMESHFPIL
ncbi:conserved unknown protein [Ectocarpus siliculosus]|uniref:Pentacotripeptide-repeat region of PRORP domain-containing protein n=1 Tax=Ectocarpus siliculosus TaxID=2880 RepID=D8LBV9_ECTSI|nr:conserved unknown protein [Ectocarpus siliculosus]|eukprot:CBN79142.1 conserved unknown protein [Ectocarpus siliculosus]